MRLEMAPCRDQSLLADEYAVVSPELALVDADLAAWLRGRGRELESHTQLQSARAYGSPAATVGVRDPASPSAPLTDAAVAPRRVSARVGTALGLVAVITLSGLLLLDVRVQVGQTPAAAESLALQNGSQRAGGAPQREPLPLAKKDPKVRAEAAPTRGSPIVPPPAKVAPKARATPSETLTSRQFAWAPVDGASGYEVQLFRGSVRIYSGSSSRPTLSLPARWTHDGIEYSLRPGAYRWYVWPVVSGRRAARAVVQANLVVA